MTTMPTLVPGDLRDTLESYVRFADYALQHGRDEWSQAYVEHVERGLEKLRAIGAQMDELRLEDERAALVEHERKEAEEPKKKVSWMRY